MRVCWLDENGESMGAENGGTLRDAKEDAAAKGCKHFRTFTSRRKAGRDHVWRREYVFDGKRWRLTVEDKYVGGNEFLRVGATGWTSTGRGS